MPLFKQPEIEQKSEIYNRQGCEEENPSNQITSNAIEEKVKISFSAKKEFMNKVQEAQMLLSSKYPKSPSLEELFSEALECLIQKRSPQRKQKRKEKRSNKTLNKNKEITKNQSRHIPAYIRDAVLKRDNYECSFIASDGIRCGCKWDLEIEHIIPFAVCKKHEIDNLKVLCRNHNMYTAQQFFGKEFIEAKCG